MFGVEILEVAIGLAFTYLLLSLIVTATNELFAAWFKRRAWMLHKGIVNLLDHPAIAQQLFDHPLIRSLYETKGVLSRVPGMRRLVGRGPSYIPAHTFAETLLDIVYRDNALSIDTNAGLGKALNVLLKEAGNDREKFKKRIEMWFSDSMERVSGWYKRHSQVVSVIWAVIITVALNADTLVITRALWSDPLLRQSVVTRAEQWVRDHPPAAAGDEPQPSDAAPPPPLPPYEQADLDFRDASAEFRAAMADLDALQLPIGWRPAPPPSGDEDVAEDGAAAGRITRSDDYASWPSGSVFALSSWGRWSATVYHHLFGWLLTVVAISLGAPFWFDVLNKIVSIRSAGKAPEEKQKSPKKVPEPREPGAPEPGT